MLGGGGVNSDEAQAIARGVRRHLRELGLASVVELPLPSYRRADVVGLGADGALTIVEIKSSPADFRADRKWREYRDHCDRFYFAISTTTPPEIMPEEAGLMLADRFGAMILREAAPHPLKPATRRAMLLRFARAAADRLYRVGEPEASGGFDLA